MENNKSLLDLADEYAKASNITAADIFKKSEKKEETKKEDHNTNNDLFEETIVTEESKENDSTNDTDPGTLSLADKLNSAKKEMKSNKKAWTPDAALLEDMPETQTQGVVYDKKDVVLKRDEKLVNIMDEKMVETGTSKVQEMVRMNQNIEIAKQRRKIKHFFIPQGPIQMQMTLAASDPDVNAAQTALDEIIDSIAQTNPEMIEYEKDDSNDNKESVTNNNEVIEESIKEPEKKVEEIDKTLDEESIDDDNEIDEENDITEERENTEDNKNEEPVIEETNTDVEKHYDDTHEIDELKIEIDKAKLSNITWSPEDIEKVRKSRIVKLNIIEKDDIEFGTIKNADEKMVDLVTQAYYRKNNDIEAVLPASHYRATFSGLTYTEVLDLRTSQEVNPIDSERVKWGICFKHIHNQNIGPWEEYVLYRDPTTQEEFKVNSMKEVPKRIPNKNIHKVSKEEDFLRKTSYVDLEFILWKILCATSMPEEIIQFTCSNKVNGTTCNNVYDWIYQPSALLDESTIEPAVLEEMAKTGNAMSKEEILSNYNDSLLTSQNYVRLPSSKFVVLYGHASAYEYINDIYPLIRSLGNKENIDNPLSISKMLRYLALACIRELLIPNKNNDGYIRIRGGNNISKILDTFNEFDWRTINEIAAMIINPYNFRYVMKNIVCPKCGHKEDVEIDTIVRLLFIVAQSLENVQVSLTRK